MRRNVGPDRKWSVCIINYDRVGDEASFILLRSGNIAADLARSVGRQTGSVTGGRENSGNVSGSDWDSSVHANLFFRWWLEESTVGDFEWNQNFLHLGTSGESCLPPPDPGPDFPRRCQTPPALLLIPLQKCFLNIAEISGGAQICLLLRIIRDYLLPNRKASSRLTPKVAESEAGSWILQPDGPQVSICVADASG